MPENDRSIFKVIDPNQIVTDPRFWKWAIIKLYHNPNYTQIPNPNYTITLISNQNYTLTQTIH